MERARQRHADLANLQDRPLIAQICREVGCAITEGRKAKTAPREACLNGDDRNKIEHGGRYVWTAARHRVYVVKPERGMWWVVTTLATVHSTR